MSEDEDSQEQVIHMYPSERIIASAPPYSDNIEDNISPPEYVYKNNTGQATPNNYIFVEEHQDIENGNIQIVEYIDESKLRWATMWAIIGIILWPCSIMGYWLVYDMKKKMSSVHPIYFRVSMIYFVTLIEMFVGIVGTLIAFIVLISKHVI